MAEPEPTRRSFLDAGIKTGLAILAGGMAVPAAIYLWPAQRRGPTDAVVSGGPADSFEPGTARMLQVEGRPILLIAVARGRYRAFSAICTHLGCVVRWDAATGAILCPCHAGAFGSDGRVKGGPPPRPLPEYEVTQVGNELRVKT